MVQVLLVRVHIGVVIYEAMTSQSGMSMTSQYGMSVAQVLIVRVDTGVMTYQGMTSQIFGCQSGYRSGDLRTYDTQVWQVRGSRPGCQSGYRSGDL